jgi:hypothetical protein
MVNSTFSGGSNGFFRTGFTAFLDISAILLAVDVLELRMPPRPGFTLRGVPKNRKRFYAPFLSEMVKIVNDNIYPR